jgi:tRNA(fMet)-specific endonuclease VapC
LSYLLDTDTVSNLLRRAPSVALVRKLASTGPESQHISSITVGELMFGAHRHPTMSTLLLERIEGLILAHLPVVSFDELAARHYGRIRATLEKAGASIGDADLRIAAIGVARGMTVVTGNVRHFQRVAGLQVENWLTGD